MLHRGGSDDAEHRHQLLAHERVRGEEYDVFVEEFITAATERWPHVLLQWEDFAKHKAFTLLSRYRDRLLSFDDDIQGTGAVALAAITTAMRAKKSRFADQRFMPRTSGYG